MGEITIDGLRTWCEEHGSGPPVVLVHGLGGTGSEVWKHVILELARDFRVVSYDLRGSGRTAALSPYSLGQLVDDLDALVRFLAADSLGLIGHSLGGTIVLAYAAEHSERVSALVGAGAPTTFPAETRDALRTRADTVERSGMAAVAETVAANGMASSFRERHPEKLRAYVELLERNDPGAYAALCRAVAEVQLDDAVERIACPAVLISGEHDAVAPPAASEQVASRIPDARFVRVPDCGHILPWEKPKALVAAARPLLEAALVA